MSVVAGSGGAPTFYTVNSSPGRFTCSTITTSCTVFGLTNGTAYTFTANASNTAGTSATSVSSVSVTPAAPTPTPTPTPNVPTPNVPRTLDPIVLPTPPPAGFATVRDNSGSRTVAISTNKAQTIIRVSGNGWRVAMGGSEGGRSKEQLVGGNIVRVVPSQFLRLQGAGYKPRESVKVFMMSTPVILGSVRADAKGKFSALLPLPANISVGVHTVQVNGFRANNELLSVSMAIRVSKAVNPIQSQKVFALGSPKLDKATKRALDKLIHEPKRATNRAWLQIGDARTAAKIKADPTLAEQVATAVANYLRSEGIKNPIPIRYAIYTGTPRPDSKGILVTVFIRSR